MGYRNEFGAGRRNRTSDLYLTRGALFRLSYASEEKDKWTAFCFASHDERQPHERRPCSGRSRCQTAGPLLAEFGRSWSCTCAVDAHAAQNLSVARARSWRTRRKLHGRNAQQRRAAAQRALVRRGFARCLNVLWAIGPSCLCGGGLALPPVIPVVLASVRPDTTSE